MGNASLRSLPLEAAAREAGAAAGAESGSTTACASDPLSPSASRERAGGSGRESRGWRTASPRPGGPHASPLPSRGHQLVPVHLRYRGPANADVAVAGSWDGWTARIPLAYIGGCYARLLNLEPGTHHYKYIVNGEWQHYSGAPTSVDPMGNVNNVLTAEFVAADTGNTAVLATGEMGIASGSDFFLDGPTVEKAGSGMRGSHGSGGYDNDVGNTLCSPGGSSTTRGTSGSPDPPTPGARHGPAASVAGLVRPSRSPDPPPAPPSDATRSAPTFTLTAAVPRPARKADAAPSSATPVPPPPPGSRYGTGAAGTRVLTGPAAASSPPETYNCTIPNEVSRVWAGGSLRRTGAGNMNPLAAAVAVGGHADEPPSLPSILITPSIRAGVTTGCSSAPTAAARTDSMGHVLVGHLFVSLHATPPPPTPRVPPSSRSPAAGSYAASNPASRVNGADIWEAGADHCVDAEGAVVVAVVRRYATKRVTSLVYLPETIA